MKSIKNRLPAILVTFLLMITMTLLFNLTKTFAGEGIVKIGNNSYNTLEEAFKAAVAGDILELKESIEIKNQIKVPAEKNLTLNLNGNTITSALSDEKDYAFLIDEKGNFTIKNGKLTAKDLDGNGFTSAGIKVTKANLVMDGIEAFNIKAENKGSVLSKQTVNNETLKIVGCYFHDNRALKSGGAVDIFHLGKDAKCEIVNSRFINNKAEILKNSNIAEPYLVWGGAINYYGLGELIIRGNEVSGNEVKSEKLYQNRNWSVGGGIQIKSYRAQPIFNNNLRVTIEDNIISKNKAQFYGGGLALDLNKYLTNDQINLVSGLFSENKAGVAGGGLDYIGEHMPLLKLKNVLMKDNKAIQAGGLYLGQNGKIRNHSTFGVAISDNSIYKDRAAANSSDIRLAKFDFDENEGEQTPLYDKFTLPERTFMGNKLSWYNDKRGALYKEGDTPLERDAYSNRKNELMLKGSLLSDKDWYELHKDSADLIFIGNIAGTGGAIVSGSDIDFGEDLDIKCKVDKKWIDENGKEITKKLPKEVEVQLIRKDEKGGIYELEKVKLNKKGNWSYDFTDLPSMGIVNGETLKFSYEVKEISKIKGFKSNIEQLPATDDVEYNYLITNTKEKITENPDKPNKPDTSNKKDNANSIKTGDMDSIMQFAIIGILSFVAFIALIIKKLKTK